VVVYVEVPYNEQGNVQGGKKAFRGDRVDSVVVCVGGVGIYNPEGVKAGPEKRYLGGDIEGKDLIHAFEPWEDRKGGKKRHMNIGRHPGLPNQRKERLKAVKGGKVSLADRRLLQKN